MRPKKHRAGFLLSALLVLGTFVVGTLLAGWVIYAILGGHSGIIQGGGLVLILGAPACGIFAAQAVGAVLMRRVKRQAWGSIVSRATRTPFVQAHLKKLVDKGIYVCLHCAHMQQVNPADPPSKCSCCGKSLPDLLLPPRAVAGALEITAAMDRPCHLAGHGASGTTD